MKRNWLIALFVCLTLPLAMAGCDLIDPDDDGDHEDDENGYRDLPAMATDTGAAIVDPYDGSLDLIDPVAKTRRSIRTTPDVQHAVLIEDGTAVAVLDSVEDRLLVVDIVQETVRYELETGEAVNRLIASPYGSHVLAIYDPSAGEAEYGEGGTINYYELNVIDTDAGTVFTASVDFTPSNIQFNPDGSGCLLGKDFRLIYLDLATGDMTSYPLSLGHDDARLPRAIEYSPDGEFAMVLVYDLSDVYVLDLVGGSINILDMPGQASSIRFLPDTRLALIPIPSQDLVDVVDLDAAIPEQVDLGIGADTVVLSPDGTQAAFYSSSGRELVVMDVDDFDTDYYELSVRVDDYVEEPVAFAPSGEAIVAFGLPGSGSNGYYDMDIIDLRTRVVNPIGLESRPIAYAFGDGSAGILLPLIDKFVRLDLTSKQSVGWEIGGRPLRVSYLEGPQLYMIDHDDPDGRLSFVGDMEDFEEDPVWVIKDFFDR